MKKEPYNDLTYIQRKDWQGIIDHYKPVMQRMANRVVNGQQDEKTLSNLEESARMVRVYMKHLKREEVKTK